MPNITTIHALQHSQKRPHLESGFPPSPSWEAGDCSQPPPMAHRVCGCARQPRAYPYHNSRPVQARITKFGAEIQSTLQGYLFHILFVYLFLFTFYSFILFYLFIYLFIYLFFYLFIFFFLGGGSSNLTFKIKFHVKSKLTPFTLSAP